MDLRVSGHQNPSSLEKLIMNCLRITYVVGVQNFKSLKLLAITNCPELQLSPNEYLPCSLKFLKVSNCIARCLYLKG